MSLREDQLQSLKCGFKGAILTDRQVSKRLFEALRSQKK